MPLALSMLGAKRHAASHWLFLNEMLPKPLNIGEEAFCQDLAGAGSRQDLLPSSTPTTVPALAPLFLQHGWICG